MASGGYRARFFKEPLAPDLKAVIETERARPLHAEYHRFDKAHVVMLAEQNLIPVEAAARILDTLVSLETGDLGERRESAGGGAHAGEQYVSSLIGPEIGGYINLGRSTGDLTATAVRMRLRRRLLAQATNLAATRAALLRAAEAHLDTVLVGYTHAQQTHAVTLGHVLAGYAAALGRDHERIAMAIERADRCPAGAAIMAGSSMALNRERVATLLGFSCVDVNTYDAVLAQDVLIEGLWAVAMTAEDLARISEDLTILSSTEIGIVAVPDRYSGTSSIAAHKRNPYATQVIKGGAAAAVGALVTGFTVEKGPTGMAMQDRAYTLKAMWAGIEDLERHLRWTADIVEGLQVNGDQALTLAESYWATSTDVAALLVDTYGLPWRTAHQIVGLFVREAHANGLGPRDVTPADLAAAATEVTGAAITVSESELVDALSARSFVRRRSGLGGPAPDAVRAHLADLETELAADGDAIARATRHVEAADASLREAVTAWISAGERHDA